MNLLIDERVKFTMYSSFLFSKNVLFFPSVNVLYNWEHVYSYLFFFLSQITMITLLTSSLSANASLDCVLRFECDLQALFQSLTKS